jgi:hypothetical protein
MSMGADYVNTLVDNLAAASDGLSLATNIVATALIGHVYW